MNTLNVVESIFFAALEKENAEARQSLANANTTAAANQLGAFINQLNALARSHRLHEITTDSLVNEVDNLITLIN